MNTYKVVIPLQITYTSKPSDEVLFRVKTIKEDEILTVKKVVYRAPLETVIVIEGWPEEIPSIPIDVFQMITERE